MPYELAGTHNIELDGDLFLVRTPFSPEIRAALIAIPQRAWDRVARYWVIPPLPASADALLRVGDAFSLTASAEARSHLNRLALVLHEAQADGRFRSESRYVFTGPTGDILIDSANVHVHDDAQGTAGAVRDRNARCFRVPVFPQSSYAVLAIAQEYGLFIEPETHQRLIASAEIVEEDEYMHLPHLRIPEVTLFHLLGRIHPVRRDLILDALRQYDPSRHY